MKTFYFTWLCAGLLGLPGRAHAQADPGPHPLLATAALPSQPAIVQRLTLGAPPQLLAEPDGAADLEPLLRQLEQAARQSLDSAAPVPVGVSALQELARQLAATRRQVADLRRQLAATQRVAAGLLLDQTELTDLRQQLHLLQSQLAAATAARPFRALGWMAD